MKQVVEDIPGKGAEEVSPVPPEPEPKELYDLHIKVPSEMKQKLKDAAELAYKIELIAKPDLVDLMNLYIGWGMAILKRHGLDRLGYR